jgi:Transglycosylase SLT domain
MKNINLKMRLYRHLPLVVLAVALGLGAHVVIYAEPGGISCPSEPGPVVQNHISTVKPLMVAVEPTRQNPQDQAWMNNADVTLQYNQETKPIPRKPETHHQLVSTSTPDKKTEQEPFQKIITKAARTYGIESALIKAIIFAESGNNPQAVSKKGAMGLMQLMPKTAEAMGVEDGFDPEHNILGGVKYFKFLVNKFEGDISLALAAYNAGIKNVRKHRGIPPFEVTRKYISKVMKYYRIYKEKNNSA